MDAEIRSVGDTSGLTLLLGRAGRWRKPGPDVVVVPSITVAFD